MSKKSLGQFYTKNYEKILYNFSLPKDNIFIEPFAGEGDLMNYILKTKKDAKIFAYDIEPKRKDIIMRNTLLFPPNYENKYIITNPPYLAKNKNKNKEIYKKYNENDLYKCFLRTIINKNASGGILILPVNFLCSIRKKDTQLRKDFLHEYRIIIANIFEYPVFSDTNYSVCSFQFEKGINEEIDCYVHTIENTKLIKLNLNEKNNFTIGGEIYSLPLKNRFTIERLLLKKTENITNIKLCALDSKGKENISLSYNTIPYFGKKTSRTFATLVITPKIDEKIQRIIIEKFNEYISKKRKKYNSLFLTNYREGKRKRISFDLVYRIVEYFLEKLIKIDF